MNFFWSKTTKNPYQKNSKNFGREKQGKKKCQKTLFFRRQKKLSKNSIFQERKKMSKTPTKKKFEKFLQPNSL